MKERFNAHVEFKLLYSLTSCTWYNRRSALPTGLMDWHEKGNTSGAGTEIYYEKWKKKSENQTYTILSTYQLSDGDPEFEVFFWDSTRITEKVKIFMIAAC